MKIWRLLGALGAIAAMGFHIPYAQELSPEDLKALKRLQDFPGPLPREKGILSQRRSFFSPDANPDLRPFYVHLPAKQLLMSLDAQKTFRLKSEKVVLAQVIKSQAPYLHILNKDKSPQYITPIKGVLSLERDRLLAPQVSAVEVTDRQFAEDREKSWIDWIDFHINLEQQGTSPQYFKSLYSTNEVPTGNLIAEGELRVKTGLRVEPLWQLGWMGSNFVTARDATWSGYITGPGVSVKTFNPANSDFSVNTQFSLFRSIYATTSFQDQTRQLSLMGYSLRLGLDYKTSWGSFEIGPSYRFTRISINDATSTLNNNANRGSLHTYGLFLSIGTPWL